MIIASIYPCPFDVQDRHDLSATIIKDGVVYAYEEDKLTEVKHEGTVKFPERSLMMGCKEHKIVPSQVEKWVLPVPSAPVDLKEQYLFFSYIFKAYKEGFDGFDRWYKDHVVFVPHQIAHAACAVLASGFKECAFLCQDGGGDFGDQRDLVFGEYKNNQFYIMQEHFGIKNICSFHAFITDSLGFSGGDNGKTSGLASYGTVHKALAKGFLKLIAVNDSGIEFFRKRYNITEVNLKKIRPHEYDRGKIFYQFPSDTNILRMSLDYLPMDAAATGEHVLRLIITEFLKKMRRYTSMQNAVFGGGLFQNVALNNAILESRLFNQIFIPMAPSDAGLSLGQALYVANQQGKWKRPRPLTPYLGPSFSKEEIRELLDRFRLIYTEEKDIAKVASELIAKGKVVGWFQERAEFGPRSLGARSILADPRKVSSKSRINQFLKKRDWFMPYAPSIQEEYLSDWVHLPQESPYMQIAFKIKEEKKALIPAAVHVDNTSRLHVLSKKDNPRYWNLIDHFRKITGIPLVLNTSFNRHGIATISTPRQAVEHLLEGCMDYLAMDDFLVEFSKNRRVDKYKIIKKKEEILLKEDCVRRLRDVFSHGTPQQIVRYLRRLSEFTGIRLRKRAGKNIAVENKGTFNLESAIEVMIRMINLRG